MKPIKITQIIVLGLIFLSTALSGQTITTSFSPANANVSIGGTVDLQLRVTNFNNIISVQLPVTFNQNILEFQSASGFALPGFNMSNYSSLPGQVRLSWFVDLVGNPNGVSLPNGTSIITLRFKAIANGTVTVNVANVPPGVEIINSNGVPVTVSFQNGGSTIVAGSGMAPLVGFHVIANGDTISPGAKFCMPVTVNDFDEIVSMQYAMHWNSTLLRFDSTRAYGLPFMGPSNFAGNTSQGTLLTSWFDNNALGISVPDLAAIYEVCFTAIGPVGSKTPVFFDGMGFPPGSGSAEVINSASEDLWDNTVSIRDTVYIESGTPPTFIAEMDTVPAGSPTCVDITVANFDSIISSQFVVSYNASVLQYQSIQFGANPLGLSIGANFNPQTGNIRFTWNDPSALGRNLPDGTVIFSICFNTIGAAGTMSDINFGSVPGFPVEVVQEPFGEVPPAFQAGKIVLTDMPDPPAPTFGTVQNVKCNGQSTGSISLNVSGGVGPFTYSWVGPGGTTYSTQNLVNVPAGTYNVTVTDANGLTGTAGPQAITQPSQPLTVPSVSVTNVNCNGGADGIITINPSGGTSPYSYLWSNNAMTKDLVLIAAGSYTVTVTDANQCTVASNPIAVSQPSSAVSVALSSTQNVACFGDANGRATIAISGGTPPYVDFKWRDTGGNLVSQVQNPTNLPAGTFQCTVTDSKGCQAILPTQVIITGPSSAITTNSNSTAVSCFGLTDGALSVTATGGWGNYSIAWTPASVTGFNPSGLARGAYNATVTDQGGCSYIMSTMIVGGATQPIQYANEVVENVNCANDSNGSISITPSGGNGAPFSVNWDGGLAGTTIGNLAGGSYAPTITDANGCTAAFPAIEVTEPDALTASANIVNVSGATPNGAIDLTIEGGTPPYDVLWSNDSTSTSLSNLEVGAYSVTISDGNGCSMVQEYSVEQDNALIGSQVIEVQNACSNNGSITIEIASIATPPYIISWNGGTVTNVVENTYTLSNLAPGTYDLTVSDNAGNSLPLGMYNVVGLSPAVVGSQINQPSCIGSDGFIILSAINDPLTYLWQHNGSTASALVNIDIGVYVVTVTNVISGCTAEYSYALECPPPLHNALVNNSDCAGVATGSIDFSFSGANGPNYTYAWAGPNNFTASTQDISQLVAGTYTVTVTDESNDQFVFTYEVEVESGLAITNVNELSFYNGFQVSGAGICDGIASVVIEGQTGNVSIAWSNGETGLENNTLCGGAYSVTVSDDLGCTTVWEGELSEPSAIVTQGVGISDYNGFNISCNGECDGIARVSANGGVPPYTVRWPSGQQDQLDNPGQFSQAEDLCGGDYVVTITDGNNVTIVSTLTVSEPDPLFFNFVVEAPTSFTRCDAELLAIIPSAVGAVEFTWTRNLGSPRTGTGPQVDGLCSGEMVQFVARDENGCLLIGTDTIPYPEDGCLRVRPVLTPGQQDGKNDFMLITCIEAVPDNVVDIYNRWGQLVFHTESYDNGNNNWRGTNSRELPLPEGVYYYIIEYTDPTTQERVQVKGNVNLLR